MGSLFRSTENTQFLPTAAKKYIRSDFPEKLTDQELQWLRDHHIITIVDLRSEEELARKPCSLQRQPGFRYLHLPVTGGNAVPKSREHLYAVYRNMVDGQMEKIVDTILEASSGVLYFCTAGKDRTGVVSALILRRLGFSDEVIIEDYMASRDNLVDMLTVYAATHPEVDPEVIIPHRENMVKLLKII